MHVPNRRLDPALYHRTTSYTGGGVGLARRRSCGAGASLRRWQHTGGVAAVYKGWRDAPRQSGSRFYQLHKVSFPPLSTSSHPLTLTSSRCCHYIVAVIIIKSHNVTLSNFFKIVDDFIKLFCHCCWMTLKMFFKVLSLVHFCS